ncbi:MULTISPECIES: hypothetical protein [Rhizobium]|nr:MULTISPECIES: hypothetical protein [Rhizobium]
MEIRWATALIAVAWLLSASSTSPKANAACRRRAGRLAAAALS